MIDESAGGTGAASGQPGLEENMQSSLRITWGSRSITGNFRENNEDRCYVDEAGRFFLVADGMGGQSAGEKASQLAVELVSGLLEKLLDFDCESPGPVQEAIDKAVAHANSEIMALGEIEPAYHNMGTTLTFLVRVADKLYVGGVGDSRTYRLRNGHLEQLTKDHSLTQALIDAGTISQADAAQHRYRNVLWRYLGTKEGGAAVEAAVLDPRSGDRFLLCSDGVTDGITDDEVQRLLSDYDDPQSAADAIVEAAEAGGSRDNITSVVLHVE